MKKKSLNIVKIRREEGKLVENPAERKRLHDDVLTDISERMRSDDPKALSRLAMNLNWLSVWEAHNAVVEILDLNERGWKRVEYFATLQYWHIRIMVCLYDHDQNPKKAARVSTNSAGLCLAHCLAGEGREEQTQWLGRRFVQSFTDGSIGYWPATPFEPFMAHMFALWSGEEAPAAISRNVQLGIYADVLDAWNGPAERFTAAVCAACDYHIAKSTNGPGHSEFAVPLFEAYPAEIQAIKQVRRRLGLSMPEIDHPLMKTPLANPPTPMPQCSDPILTSVVSRVRSVYPSL